jgi:hypothetical protein
MRTPYALIAVIVVIMTVVSATFAQDRARY